MSCFRETAKLNDIADIAANILDEAYGAERQCFADLGRTRLIGSWRVRKNKWGSNQREFGWSCLRAPNMEVCKRGMTELSKTYDVIVVGAGPAGLAAGLHSALFDLRTLVIDADEEAGGMAKRARGLENYPGFNRISGRRLMERMALQAKKAGVELHSSEKVVNLSLDGGKKIARTKLGAYSGRALILATGDGMKGLGMKWETWIGGGVAYCAECGAPFFRGRDVVVVGGCQQALNEALRLTKIAERVRLVNHANAFTVIEKTRRRLEREGVRLIEDYVGIEIKGKPPFKRLVLRRLGDSARKGLRTNIVFVVGGVKPFVSVLQEAGIETHRLGCVVVDEFGRTNVRGVFAAGACASTARDIIPACVGDGTNVATSVRLFLKYGC